MGFAGHLTMKAGHLFTQIPGDLPEELETLLATGGAFRLTRIVSKGHQTPPGDWYDSAEDEWVLLLSGAAELVFEDDNAPLRMNPGDYILIRAHRRHRVSWTDPRKETVWLALYFN